MRDRACEQAVAAPMQAGGGGGGMSMQRTVHLH